jgi:hypothetical protein
LSAFNKEVAVFWSPLQKMTGASLTTKLLTEKDCLRRPDKHYARKMIPYITDQSENDTENGERLIQQHDSTYFA